VNNGYCPLAEKFVVQVNSSSDATAAPVQAGFVTSQQRQFKLGWNESQNFFSFFHFALRQNLHSEFLQDVLQLQVFKQEIFIRTHTFTSFFPKS